MFPSNHTHSILPPLPSLPTPTLLSISILGYEPDPTSPSLIHLVRSTRPLHMRMRRRSFSCSGLWSTLRSFALQPPGLPPWPDDLGRTAYTEHTLMPSTQHKRSQARSTSKCTAHAHAKRTAHAHPSARSKHSCLCECTLAACARSIHTHTHTWRSMTAQTGAHLHAGASTHTSTQPRHTYPRTLACMQCARAHVRVPAPHANENRAAQTYAWARPLARTHLK